MDLQEKTPSSGGSFIRHPESGELKQTEGPGLAPAAPAPAPAAVQTAVKKPSSANNQE